MPKASLLREFSVLKNPQVLMVLGISVLASASLFSVFTYITPILEDVTGFTPHAVTLVLLLFGLGLTVGSTLGGKLADWRLMPSLLAFLLAIVVILTIFAGDDARARFPRWSRFSCGACSPSRSCRRCRC